MSKKNENNDGYSIAAGQASDASSGKPVLEIDFEKYLKYTEKFDATEEQQRDLITCLHQIMLAFVDMGFDLNPVQHVPKRDIGCEQNVENQNSETQALTDVIQSLVSNDDELKTVFANSSEAAK